MVRLSSKKVAVRAKKPAEHPTVQKQASIMVSIGDGDRDRSMDQFLEDIKAVLGNGKVNAHHVTVANTYYIVGGKVCRVPDYDSENQNFKPGTAPPPWAGGPSPERVGREAFLPAGIRQGDTLENLEEAKASLAAKERYKGRTPKEAIADLYENTDWGRKKKDKEERERREAEAAAKKRKRFVVKKPTVRKVVRVKPKPPATASRVVRVRRK